MKAVKETEARKTPGTLAVEKHRPLMKSLKNALRFGYPNLPATEDMLMITPALDFLRCGMHSRVTLKVPVKLTRTTLSQSSGSRLSTGSVGPEMPTLFTSTSKLPNALAKASTSRATSWRFDTSHGAVAT